MNSLVKRVLTAAVLVPFVVWVVLFSSDLVFNLVLSLVVLPQLTSGLR